MTEALEFFRYATSNGFLVFVGCAILLAIVTDGLSSALAFVSSLFKTASR